MPIGFAPDIKGAREALRKQFPPVEDVSLEEFLRLVREILADTGAKGRASLYLDRAGRDPAVYRRQCNPFL